MLDLFPRAMHTRLFVLLPILLATACVASPPTINASNVSGPDRGKINDGTIKTRLAVDVCVYGASASGIFAAVAAAREGLSVALVEPSYRIGGLLASGFRVALDVPEPRHLGGLARDFYEKDIALHQGGIQVKTLRHYQGAGKDNIALLQRYLDRYADRITVMTHYRVTRVKTEDGTIKHAVFEWAVPDKNGVPAPRRSSDDLTEIRAKVFIDASYEADLMAHSGVSYRIGRESRDEYGESLAGVILGDKAHDPHTDVSLSGQVFRYAFPGVDPYVIEGDPASGLLSPIDSDPMGNEGDASRFGMGWNFKLAWETDPTAEHPGIRIGPPENRNRDVEELLRRYSKAGYAVTWPYENWHRGELMTGAIPGMQTNYPDGDWATRAKIWQGYIDHVRTLTEFTGKEVRLLSGINDETNGWPFLYMRGGRRMVGEYVMTQHDLQLQTDVPDPIGMGYYGVDIYPTRLAVREGVLVHEGALFVLVSPGPYPIAYGAIIPKKQESKNLLVPMMMSATHVAYASIRMEATYMVMGEAAGTAAALAIQSHRAVQDIDRGQLASRLKGQGQKLEWDRQGIYASGLWRFNIFDTPTKITPRWETHPEEYSKHLIEELWKNETK